MRPFLALVRKEAAVLFGSPLAYLVVTLVALVSSIIFFEKLRFYNQILFVFASNTMGGFETDTIPDHVNLRDQVFLPVMEDLGFLMVLLVPMITMRVFAEERSRGTDELLVTTLLTPTQIVLAKFLVTSGFVALMITASFVYPALAIREGGLGLEHLLSVYIGLLLLSTGLAAIGLVCSAYSRNQLVAAVAALAAGYVLWDFSWASAFLGEGAIAFLDAIALHPHYRFFAEGVVILSHAVYFVGLVIFCFALARFSFDLRRVAG